MLSGQPFYFHTLRNLVVGFADVFNNVQTTKEDSDGNITKTITVPIEFSRRQKYIARLREDLLKNEDNTGPDRLGITLPRMSYDIISIEPDGSRKLSSLTKQSRKPSDIGVTDYLKQLSGNPFNINIELSIYTYSLDEMLQIVEQILPYFTPDYNITLIDIPELDIRKDVPIIFDSVSPTDSFEGVFDDFRVIEWTMSFTASTEFYPPVEAGDVIRRTITNIRESELQHDQRTTQELNPFDANEDDNYTVDKTIEETPDITP